MQGAVVPSATREQQLEQLISLYADTILRTCFIYLSDRGQAEDAMQDTFLKAWKHLQQTGGPDIQNEKAWLLRIAMNTCHDYHRTKWFRHVDARKALDELPPRYLAVIPQDHSLLVDVCELPEKYKQVLLLYYYQEMNLQEVAGALNISRSSVHKRLKKAQELLKGRLIGRDMDAAE